MIDRNPRIIQEGRRNGTFSTITALTMELINLVYFIAIYMDDMTRVSKAVRLIKLCRHRRVLCETGVLAFVGVTTDGCSRSRGICSISKC